MGVLWGVISLFFIVLMALMFTFSPDPPGFEPVHYVMLLVMPVVYFVFAYIFTAIFCMVYNLLFSKKGVLDFELRDEASNYSMERSDEN
jgi:hypothetical protein